MPILQLKISRENVEGLDMKSLAQGLTQISSETLRKRAEVTAVMIDVMPSQSWFVGGERLTAPAAYLEINITQGTNSTEEKAEFLRRAYRFLCDRLNDGAGLNEASYLVVHELPPQDWGYDGLSQAARLKGRAKL